MRGAVAAPRCTLHARVRAGWRCTVCDKDLCVNCAGYRRIQSTHLLTCVHCHERAEPIRIRRAEAQSFASLLPRAMLYPFSLAGLVAIFAAGLVFYASNFFGCFGTLAAQAILWSWVFHLARRTAQGSDVIEPPDFSEVGDLLSPFFRGSFAVLVSWLPALVFVALMPDGPPVANPRAGLPVVQQVRPNTAEPPDAANVPATEEGTDRGHVTAERVARVGIGTLLGQNPLVADSGVVRREPATLVEPGWSRALKHPAFWALLLLGFVLGPMSLAIAVAGRGFLDMMNPVRLVGCALRFPKSYALLAGTLLGLGLLQLGVSVGADLMTLVAPPIVAELAGGMLLCVLPMVAGRVLGLYLYVYGAALGYLHERDEWVNVLGALEPVGVLRDVGVQRPQPRRRPDAAPQAEEGGVTGITAVAANWKPRAPVQLQYPPGADEDASGTADTYVRPREIDLPSDHVPAAAAASQPPADARPREDLDRRSHPPEDTGGHDALDGASATSSRLPEVPPSLEEVDRAARFVTEARVAEALAESAAAEAEEAAEEAEIARLGMGTSEMMPPPTVSPEEALRAAVERRDFAEALQHHRVLDDESRALLPGDVHFEVGRQAAGEGDFEYAIHVLHAAAQANPDDPVAPRALIVMARIMGERLGDAAGAERVYRFVAKTYPGTDAAAFADKRLGAAG